MFLSFVQPASATATPACATPTTASVSAPLKASKEIAATCEFLFLSHFLLFSAYFFFYVLFTWGEKRAFGHICLESDIKLCMFLIIRGPFSFANFFESFKKFKHLFRNVNDKVELLQGRMLVCEDFMKRLSVVHVFFLYRHTGNSCSFMWAAFNQPRPSPP